MDDLLVASRRTQAQLINFGVAAVARATGRADDALLLDLRCECGAPGCSERLELPCREYEALAGASELVLAPAHEL